MIEACCNVGLNKPLLEEIGTHFRITIFMQKIYSLKAKELNEIDKLILNFFKKGEGLSTQQTANKIGLTTHATRSHY